MSIISQINEAERGANLFVALAQITRLLHAAHTKDLTWSYEVERIKGADGAVLGKCYEDGCEIRIRIRPSESQNGPGH